MKKKAPQKSVQSRNEVIMNDRARTELDTLIPRDMQEVIWQEENGEPAQNAVPLGKIYAGVYSAKRLSCYVCEMSEN